jgi:DnaJ-class molecular chaperone
MRRICPRCGGTGFIEDEDEPVDMAHKGEQVIAHVRGIGTLLLKMVDCGKCPNLHGPYLYIHKKVGNRIRCSYVGKI